MKYSQIMNEHIFDDQVTFSDDKIGTVKEYSNQQLKKMGYAKLDALEDKVQDLISYVVEKEEEYGDKIVQLAQRRYPDDVMDEQQNAGEAPYPKHLDIITTSGIRYFINLAGEGMKDPKLKELLLMHKRYNILFDRMLAYKRRILQVQDA